MFLLLVFILYVSLVFIISYFSTKNLNNKSYFTANRKSNWIVVSIGMLGVAISSVTFISVPGLVKDNNFSYYQFVIGNFLGFIFIALFLLPRYYKNKIITIYSILGEKIGFTSQKTASIYFIISRFLGSGLRLFLGVKMLHYVVFDALNVNIIVVSIFIVALIYLYTIKGGIKTVIWTDFIQTFALITSLFVSIYFISNSLELNIANTIYKVYNSEYSKIFHFVEWNDNKNIYKNIISGFLITISMVGLDQDLMQKNLTCKNINQAKKNMILFSFIFLIIVFIFLSLGVLLYKYAEINNIIEIKDKLFPSVVINFGSYGLLAFFVIGIVSTTFSSIDSTITSITTSVYTDLIKKTNRNKALKNLIHMWVSISFLVLIVLLTYIDNNNIVTLIFKTAGYTYGPILGLFFLSFINKIYDNKTILISSILAPFATYLFIMFLEKMFFYKVGFEIIVFCSLFTIIPNLITSKPKTNNT